jgi:DMSO/TMAO reductase YedYZ molybdopterin-dependent catalytic subunit
VGAQLIDLTPTVAKEWAIAHFGTADKPILITGVMLVVLAASSIAGLAARRRPLTGAAIFAVLAAVAGVVTLLRPGASTIAVLPAAVTGLGSVSFLALANRTASAETTVRGRRAFLTAMLVLAVAGATEAAARHIVRRRISPASVTLPDPSSRAPELPRGLDIPGITPFRTTNRDFYRVDTRLNLPTVDIDAWKLVIDGGVRNPLAFTFESIAAMALIERDITLTCVSNEVGGRYVGGARWLGVRLTDLLDRAGVRAGADQILSTDVDGMTISTPLSIATDGRESMIAIGMNGDPLPREHGFPARLIVPGLYGFVGATKWITRMTLTTYAEQDAYWTKRGWATEAPIKPSSRIDTPRPFATIRDGDEVTIGGIAWAQNSGGVSRVEVSIDDAPWQQATLGPSGGPAYWRQWFLKWTATPGSHTIAARADTARGRVQTAKRSAPFPNGSSGIQRLSITVT